MRQTERKLNQNACTLCKQEWFTAEGTYIPGRYLLFPLEPSFDEIIFPKAFYTQSLWAHKSRVRVTGGMGKLSIGISQLKAAQDSSSACRLPVNCYLPGWSSNKTGRVCFLKLQTSDKEKPLSMLYAHLTGKQLPQLHYTQEHQPFSPLLAPAALRQLSKTREFQVLQRSKYIGQH